MNEKFKQNLSAVMEQFGLTEDELLERTKRRINVDARQVLFLMCVRDEIPLNYIQRFLKKKGFELSRSTILHGVHRAEMVLMENREIHRFVNG
jgi:2-iminoacetate synthase ThiH